MTRLQHVELLLGRKSASKLYQLRSACKAPRQLDEKVWVREHSLTPKPSRLRGPIYLQRKST